MKEIAYIYRKQIISTGRFYIGKHNGKTKNYKGSGRDWKIDLENHVTDYDSEVITEILEYIYDIETINDREIYWLEKFNAKDDPLYYNLSNRSYGLSSQSDYTKQLKSKSLTGRIIYWKDKISSSLIGKNKGIPKHTLKSKKQISEKMLNHPSIINNKERGNKISKSLKNNYDRNQKISNSLKNKPKSELHKLNMKKPKPPGFSDCTKKPIYQLDKDKNILKEYPSITEASISTGFNLQAISNCALGKSKSSMGFLWEFKNKKTN